MMRVTFFLLTVFLFLTMQNAIGQSTEDKNISTLKIGLVSILVDDPIKAFKFYTDTLGFVEVMYKPQEFIAIVVSNEDKNGTSLLLEPTHHPVSKTFQKGVYDLGFPMMIFYTTDIYKEYERLKKLGVSFKKAPTENEWGIDAIFDDTCGNWIQIQQLKK